MEKIYLVQLTTFKENAIYGLQEILLDMGRLFESGHLLDNLRYRKLMLRKMARTGNKICRKHLFLARKFAR